MTPTRGKRPYRPGWQTERLGVEEMAAILAASPRDNFGVLLGEPSGWLIDIDLDHPLAVELADQFLPPTGAIFGRKSEPHSHWLYVGSGPVATQQHRLSAKDMIVELHSTGCQTVMPPSRHPSGESIEWHNTGESVAVADADPAELSAAVQRLADAVREKLGVTITSPPRHNGHTYPPTHNTHNTYDDRDKILDRARKYLSRIPPAISGQGGHAATFLAAQHLVHGFSLDDRDAYSLLAGWNQTCQPSWSEAELQHKITSARERGTQVEIGQHLRDTRPLPAGSSAAPRTETSEPVARALPRTPLPAGTKVRCSDRGNLGDVVYNDGGSTITVEHVGKDGTKTVDHPATEVRLADGMPLVLEGFELRLKTSEEFLNADFRQHFLIRRVLVQGQHCVLGGPKKVLKTSLLVDLALSLATGTPWLGNPDFAVPDAVPVMLLSGESGGYTLRETARRIALAKNQLLSSAKVFWGFDLPQLGNAEHLGVLEVEIKRLGIKVAIIDPAYLCLLSAGASANITSNVFAMGALLKNISDIGTRTGCTMIICHHTRKADRQSSPFGVPDLEDLSGSGFAEWARQWVLLNRREAYQGDGKHSLWMTGGGSAGHSGTYAFDVAEGVISEDGDGRTWDVSVSKATEAVQRSKAEKETAKEQKAREAILAAYALFPDGETGRTIREAAGISGVKFGSINAVLIAAGIVEHCQITKNKRDEAAFRLVPP